MGVPLAEGGIPRVCLLRGGVDDVLVDLVRQDDAIGTRQVQGPGDDLHLRAGKNLSGRVVRRVENDRSRAGRDGFLELVAVQLPLAATGGAAFASAVVLVFVVVRIESERDKDGFPPRQLDLVHVEIEKGLEKNHLVAGPDQRLEAQVQRLARPDGHRHLFHGADRFPQVRRIPPRQLAYEVRVPRGPRVLVGTLRRVQDRLHQRVDGELGRQPVGKALAEVDRVVFLGDSSEFRPDGGSRAPAEAPDGLSGTVGLEGAVAAAALLLLLLRGVCGGSSVGVLSLPPIQLPRLLLLSLSLSLILFLSPPRRNAAVTVPKRRWDECVGLSGADFHGHNDTHQ
mmetsp:Transcript_19888/g.41172  ORF Transcript_19888/g.41172 Transcript_19888/m.41172 type:complete len:340 (-) Transcript_19888:258-1277(-)